MSHRFILDSVIIEYDSSKRMYHIRFHKIAHNEGPDPLRHVYARIVVNVFPDDPPLARQYYRNHVLELEKIGFRAVDRFGNELRSEIQHAHDANIELLLFACDSNGHPSPVPPGHQFEYTYSFLIGDTQWGPYLERNVRVPCDRLHAKIRFEPGVARVVAQIRRPGDNWADYPIARATIRQGLEDVELSVAQPELHSRFRLRWYFSDGRERHLLESFRRSAYSQISHSPDFRTLQWHSDTYHFSPTQARCISILFSAWERKHDAVSQETILTQAESDARRLRDLFRGHPAWGNLIVAGSTRGTFRLASRAKEVDGCGK